MVDALMVVGAVLVLAVIVYLGTSADPVPPNALLFGAFAVMGAGLGIAVKSAGRKDKNKE